MDTAGMFPRGPRSPAPVAARLYTPRGEKRKGDSALPASTPKKSKGQGLSDTRTPKNLFGSAPGTAARKAAAAASSAPPGQRKKMKHVAMDKADEARSGDDDHNKLDEDAPEGARRERIPGMADTPRADNEMGIAARVPGLQLSTVSEGVVCLAVVQHIVGTTLKVMLPGNIMAEAAGGEPLLRLDEGKPARSPHGGVAKDDDSDASSSSGSSDSEADAQGTANGHRLRERAKSRHKLHCPYEVLSPGDLILASVISVVEDPAKAGRKIVHVSLHPNHVNRRSRGSFVLECVEKGSLLYGVISSMEDRGCVISFGDNLTYPANASDLAFNGFYEFDDTADEPHRHPRKMAVGTPLLVVVTDEKMAKKKRQAARTTASSGRPVVIQVSADLNLVRKKSASEYPGMAIENLLPGLLVRAIVQNTSRSGDVWVQLLTFFRGMIPWLQRPVTDEDLDLPNVTDSDTDDERHSKGGIKSAPRTGADLAPGTQVLARILFVDISLKVIGLTLLPSVVQDFTIPASGERQYPVGSIVDAKVDRIDTRLGLGLIAHVDGAGKLRCFAPNANLTDGPGDAKAASGFKRGQSVQARVLAHSKFDGAVIVSLKPSVLSLRVLSAGEVQAGEVYSATVVGPSTSGARGNASPEQGFIVKIENRVNAFVSVDHASDTSKSRKLKERFAPGSEVTVRVLWVDSKRRRIFATAKKSLVKHLTKAQVLLSLEQAASSVGEQFAGVVMGITKTKAVRVSFFNRLVGILPFGELGLDAAASTEKQVEALFPAGRTLPCRIASVDARAKRVLLSLKGADEIRQLFRSRNTASSQALGVGSLVSGRVVKILTTSFMVSVQPAATTHLDHSVDEAEHVTGSVDAELPFQHLSDIPELVPIWKAVLREAMKAGEGAPLILDRLLVIRTASTRGQGCSGHVVSLKPSLIRSVLDSKFVGALEELETGTILSGYVQHVNGHGAVISLTGGPVTGFVRKSRVADAFVSDPQDRMVVGQSVAALVESIDRETKRVMLSLRSSDIITARTAMMSEANANTPSQTRGKPPLGAFAADFPAMRYDELASLSVLFLQHAKPPRDPVPDDLGGAAPILANLQVLKPGSVIPVRATALDKSGAIFQCLLGTSTSKSLRAVSVFGQGSVVQPKIGALYGAQVLDVNIGSGLVDVVVEKELDGGEDSDSVLAARSVVAPPLLKRLVPTHKVKCTVQLVKDAEVYLSVSKKSGGSAVVVASLLEVNSNWGFNARQASAGTKTSVVDSTLRSMFTVGTTVTGVVHAVQSSDSLVNTIEVSEWIHEQVARKKPRASGAGGGSGALSTENAEGGNEEQLQKEPIAEVGSRCAGMVTSKRALQVFLSVDRSTFARLHVTDMQVTYGDEVVRKYLLEPHILKSSRIASLSMGASVDVRVYAIQDNNRAVQTDGGHAEGTRKRLASVTTLLDAKQSGCINEIDERTLWSDTLAEGRVVLGFVCSVAANEREAFVALTSSISGRVVEIEATDDLDLLSDEKKKVFDSWDVGDGVLVRVLAQNVAERRVALTSVIRSAPCAEQSVVVARIVQISPNFGVRVVLPQYTGLKAKYGRIHLAELADNFDAVEALLAGYIPGQYVQAVVVSVRDGEGSENQHNRRIDLSLRESRLQKSLGSVEIASGSEGEPGVPLKTRKRRMNHEHVSVRDAVVVAADDLKLGQKVRGFVTESHAKKGVFVELGSCVHAHVNLNQLSDGFVEDVVAGFPKGKLVSGTIIGIDTTSSSVEMSFKSAPRVDRSSAVWQLISPGDLLRGTVSKLTKYGVLISLAPGGVYGLCHRSQLKDDVSVDDPSTNTMLGLNVGDSVVAKVLKVDHAKRRVDLGLKESLLADQDPASIKSLLGLSFSEVDAGTKDIDMEPAIENNADGSSDEQASSGADETDDDEDESGSSSSGDNGSESDGQDDDKESSSSDGEGNSANIENGDQPDQIGKGNGRRSDGHGFAFFESDDEFEGAAEGERDESTGEAKAKRGSNGDDKADATMSPERKKKRGDKMKPASKERMIREREEAMLREQVLDTAEDFERVLVGAQNASLVWIRYMAFHVSLAQLAEARKVAERALGLIGVQYEAEKMNVWLAYLNLELQFGGTGGVGGVGTNETVDDEAGDGAEHVQKERGPVPPSFFTLLDRACKLADEKHLLLRMMSSVRSMPQPPEQVVSELTRRLLAKHRQSKKVWIGLAEYEYKRGDGAAARKLFERSLLSLPKYKHIRTILAFARLEYRSGSRESGRTMFEGLVGNMPKRLDFWNVYIDLELSQLRHAVAAAQDRDEAAPSRSQPLAATLLAQDTAKDVVFIRRLFERVCSLNLSSKKMKFFLKRHLEFEREYGSPAQMQVVKQRAIAYVQTHGQPQHA
ncbi:rRNA biogenesis protein rrp5 [Porphyridium purpureum]|uniref:rRNA biogenesis protein rrp5 n=1 Tax=Porphyridium purpureum TaxID=35688 RepID=A0A5J4Z119_PORPP|nr:rRNA biogenesis protein rrp5 [Porphyridium purpureum]|eukprot:POR2295..scf208_2